MADSQPDAHAACVAQSSLLLPNISDSSPAMHMPYVCQAAAEMSKQTSSLTDMPPM